MRTGATGCLREEDLAEDVVQAEQLNPGGKVGVDTVFAEVLVVLNVVTLAVVSVMANAAAVQLDLEGIRSSEPRLGSDLSRDGMPGVEYNAKTHLECCSIRDANG